MEGRVEWNPKCNEKKILEQDNLFCPFPIFILLCQAKKKKMKQSKMKKETQFIIINFL